MSHPVKALWDQLWFMNMGCTNKMWLIEDKPHRRPQRTPFLHWLSALYLCEKHWNVIACLVFSVIYFSLRHFFVFRAQFEQWQTFLCFQVRLNVVSSQMTLTSTPVHPFKHSFPRVPLSRHRCGLNICALFSNCLISRSGLKTEWKGLNPK